MYASMNTESLINEASKRPVGSLTFELVDAINGDMDELATENEELQTEAEESTNNNLDNCEEAVMRFEQIEDRLNDILETVPDHQSKGTYADQRYTLKDCLALINDAVVYFNAQQREQK